MEGLADSENLEGEEGTNHLDKPDRRVLRFLFNNSPHRSNH